MVEKRNSATSIREYMNEIVLEAFIKVYDVIQKIKPTLDSDGEVF